MERSTRAQLSMFGETSSENSSIATFSPGSEDGPTRSGSPAGRTIGKSGPDRVPVNHLARPARGAARTTSDTCGRSGAGSLESAGRQQSLANRLRALMVLNGSMVFALTWKASVTPSGRRICRLQALARSTSASDSGLSPTGWPTTTKEDARSSARHGYMITGNQGTTLLDAARLATSSGSTAPTLGTIARLRQRDRSASGSDLHCSECWRFMRIDTCR